MTVSRTAILVVEDNLMIGIDEAETLQRAGCTVVGPHARLSDAFDAIGRDRIDAAVLDVAVGDGSVYALADHLGRLKIPFMFVTGRTVNELPERFRGQPVVTKPFGQAHLIQSLTELLKRPL